MVARSGGDYEAREGVERQEGGLSGKRGGLGGKAGGKQVTPSSPKSCLLFGINISSIFFCFFFFNIIVATKHSSRGGGGGGGRGSRERQRQAETPPTCQRRCLHYHFVSIFPLSRLTFYY